MTIASQPPARRPAGVAHILLEATVGRVEDSQYVMRHFPRDPWDVFCQAVTSVVARVIIFFYVCSVTMYACCNIVSGPSGSHRQAQVIDYVTGTLASPLIWIVFSVVGVFQVWGLLSYSILASLFYFYVVHDKSHRVILTWTVLVQSMEAVRLASHNFENRIDHPFLLAIWATTVIASVLGFQIPRLTSRTRGAEVGNDEF